jgi:D-aminoacyl-tRNA deacylase
LKLLLQRVSHAIVVVDGRTIGSIGVGLLVLMCAEPNDTTDSVDKLLAKIAKLRIFADDLGKMNRSVTDIAGGVLLVPQFTLAANTNSGTRPSFTAAASPSIAKPLFEYAKQVGSQQFAQFGFGEFGADMKVSLLNDGPVTIWIDDREPSKAERVN